MYNSKALRVWLLLCCQVSITLWKDFPLRYGIPLIAATSIGEQHPYLAATSPTLTALVFKCQRIDLKSEGLDTQSNGGKNAEQ